MARSIDEDLKAAQSKEGGQEEKKLDARSSVSLISVSYRHCFRANAFSAFSAILDLMLLVLANSDQGRLSNWVCVCVIKRGVCVCVGSTRTILSAVQ